MIDWTQILPDYACREAVEWTRTQPDLVTAWVVCERGDWMLWLAGEWSGDRKPLVLAACACARLALPHVRPGDERPLRAIETTERWARDEVGVTLDDVHTAAHDAAYAAHDAADAAATAAYDARHVTLARCADIVRRYYPEPPAIARV